MRAQAGFSEQVIIIVVMLERKEGFAERVGVGLID